MLNTHACIETWKIGQADMPHQLKHVACNFEQYVTETGVALVWNIRRCPKGSEHICEHRNNVKRKNSMIFNAA